MPWANATTAVGDKDEVLPLAVALAYSLGRRQCASGVAPPAADAATTHPSTRSRTDRGAHGAMEQLLPHLVDRFALFQLVRRFGWFGALCGASSLLFPSGASLGCVAGVRVLVSSSLLGGRTPNAGTVGHRDSSVLARSILFAIGLVGIAAWGQVTHWLPLGVHQQPDGSILSRWLRQFVWKRHQHESELRKIVIVGGGPLARCIASTLRNDPLRRATICGFVDDDLPLSPAVLGECGPRLAGAPSSRRGLLVLAANRRMRGLRSGVPNILDFARSDCRRDRGRRLRRSHRRVPVVPASEPLPDALVSERAIDVMETALGIAVGSPVMAVVALLIRLDSPVGYLLASARVKGAASAATSFAPW